MGKRFARIVLFVLMIWTGPRPAHAQGRFPPDSFTNLQVLADDTGSRELVQMMVGFTRALGIQ